MLIPAIDLRGGKVVQLVQGERLAYASTDIDGWAARFARCPLVHVIDLDAALGAGDNLAIVERLAGRLPCRTGGGVRTIARARRLLDAGARQVIVGSAFYREGEIDLAFAAALARAVGAARVVAAVDARGGRVAVHGWRRTLPLAPADAVRALDPYCGGFLYTHIDTEGLLQGTDLNAVLEVRRATRKPVAAAGGIATSDEVARLEALGVDAVVGLAIYTGRLHPEPPPTAR
jgi:phosphoribosylformimino-5-aminoimidazole carboxamide ribotide isomerase